MRGQARVYPRQCSHTGTCRRRTMQPILGKLSEPIYGMMRIIVGFLFACHGAQKVFGVFGWPGHAHGRMLVAGGIELVSGGLIVLGLFTSFAAFIASGEMAAAYLMGHAPHGFWPIVNKGELAAAYCFVFLYIAALGSSPLGAGSLLGRRERILLPSWRV